MNVEKHSPEYLQAVAEMKESAAFFDNQMKTNPAFRARILKGRRRIAESDPRWAEAYKKAGMEY